MAGLKLNLCSGDDVRAGFINIDVRRTDPRVLVRDLESGLLSFMPDGVADEVLMNDCLEHISWRRVKALVADIARVLRPGGRLQVRVPDMGKIMSIYSARAGEPDVWLELSYYIYGGQDYPENTHKSGFTRASIKALLESVGLSVQSIDDDPNCPTNMIVRAVKK